MSPQIIAATEPRQHLLGLPQDIGVVGMSPHKASVFVQSHDLGSGVQSVSPELAEKSNLALWQIRPKVEPRRF